MLISTSWRALRPLPHLFQGQRRTPAVFHLSWFAVAALMVACGMSADERAANKAARETYARDLINRGLLQEPDHRVTKCINTCAEDPGPRPVGENECLLTVLDHEALVAAGIDTHEYQTYEYIPIWDFEGESRIYDYDDGSTLFKDPDGFNPWHGNPDIPVDEDFFDDPWGLCGREGNHYFRFRGGPFRGYGGGYGARLGPVLNNPCRATGLLSELCPFEDPADGDRSGPYDDESVGFWWAAAENESGAPTNAGSRSEWNSLYHYDLTDWDGISFWARRGPNSQTGVRVVVGDMFMDDDKAFLDYFHDQPRTCERVRECGCRNQRPCSPVPQPDTPSGYLEDGNGQVLTFCWDPEVDPVPNRLMQGDMTAIEGEIAEHRDPSGILIQRYDACGTFRCNLPYPSFGDAIQGETGYADPQFNGRPCTPYTFRTGLGGSYCFDPAVDPEPANTEYQCGDYWTKSINLRTDWQFYRIPFTDMIQQGWAKEFHEMRLDAITVIRFTYDKGWVDIYLDDVSFYRKKREDG